MTQFPCRRPSVVPWRTSSQDTCRTCGHVDEFVLGIPFPALAITPRTVRRLCASLAGWVRGLVRAPVRFTVTAADPAVLAELAACAPPRVLARCVRAHVRVGAEQYLLVRMHVVVRGRADVGVLRRWLLDGLRHYDGEVRINGVLVDRDQRRLGDA